MQLTVLTYNTLFAGYDGDDGRRAVLQHMLLQERRPDVFLMQEARGFEAQGGVRLHALEARLGMRGFLARAPRTGQNVGIFIREPLRPVAFEAEDAQFHHALAMLTVVLPGGRQVSLTSAHLTPVGAVPRQSEAAHLAVRAAPGRLALLAGDFNSASPHDPEPDGFADLSPHHRARYVAPDRLTADRSVLEHLEGAGWRDVACALGGNGIPTVPTSGFRETEFPVMRCDYVLASAALAACARTYEVIRTPATDTASDHYPVLATFEVP